VRRPARDGLRTIFLVVLSSRGHRNAHIANKVMLRNWLMSLRFFAIGRGHPWRIMEGFHFSCPMADTTWH
jgi:hypothetical protein